METVLGHNYGAAGGSVLPGKSGTVAVNALAELLVQIDVRDSAGNLQQLQVDPANGRQSLLVIDPVATALIEQLVQGVLELNARLALFLDQQSRIKESNV